MSFILNPFIPNSLPLIFSDSDRNIMLSTLKSSGGFLQVVGECGTGKTAVFNYLQKINLEMPEEFGQYILVYLNCQDRIITFTPDEFWKKIFLEIESISNEKIDLDRSQEGFESFIKESDRQNKRVVLLLDDFDCLIQVDDLNREQTRSFLHGLRSLTTRQNHKVNLATATRSDLHKLWEPLAAPGFSDFPNASVYLRLPISWKEDIFTQYIEISKANFKMKDIRFISNLSNSHPKLSQVAARMVFNKHIDCGHINCDGFLTQQDLDDISFEFYTCPDVQSVFQGFWHVRDESERSLLMLIALNNLQITERTRLQNKFDLTNLNEIFIKKSKIIDRLVARGILTRNGSSVNITFPLFSIFILKIINEETPQEIQEHLMVWGGLISQNQVNQIESLVKFFKKNEWIANNRDTIITWIKNFIQLLKM